MILLERLHLFQVMVKEDYWGLTSINYTEGRWQIIRQAKKGDRMVRNSFLQTKWELCEVVLFRRWRSPTQVQPQMRLAQRWALAWRAAILPWATRFFSVIFLLDSRVLQGGDCLRLPLLSPRPAWHQHRHRPPHPCSLTLLLLLPHAEEAEAEVEADQQPVGHLWWFRLWVFFVNGVLLSNWFGG